MQEVPNDLFVATSEALAILSWLENLPSDECPPRNIWHHSKRIEEWFADIKRKRENPGKEGHESVPDPGMDENEYAKAFLERVNRG